MNTIHKNPGYTGLLFGVELEIEAEGLYQPEERFDDEGDLLCIDEPDIPHGWLREHEESIRGVELISARPFDYATSVDNIYRLFNDIDAQGYTPTRTCRGSTHVHVNAADLTWAQLRSFVMTCAWAEPFLIEHAGAGRRGNLFAQSYETTPLGWRPIITWCRHEAVMHALDTHYMATSFSPLSYLGSVEFRMGPSARTAAEAIAWLDKIYIVASHGRLEYVDDNISTVESMLRDLSKGLSPYTVDRLRHKAQRFASEIWQDLNEPLPPVKPRSRKKTPANVGLVEEIISASPMISLSEFYQVCMSTEPSAASVADDMELAVQTLMPVTVSYSDNFN